MVRIVASVMDCDCALFNLEVANQSTEVAMGVVERAYAVVDVIDGLEEVVSHFALQPVGDGFDVKLLAIATA